MNDGANKGGVAALLAFMRFWQSAEWRACIAEMGRASADTETHTRGMWRKGRLRHTGLMACVVADFPVPEIGGSDETAYYGGHLIGESMSHANAERVIACVNACRGIPTAILLAMANAPDDVAVADDEVVVDAEVVTA